MTLAPTSSRFDDVVAGTHRAVVRARVLRTTQFGPDPDGEEVPILDGDVQISSTADVKRTCEVVVPGDWWGSITPHGDELFIERGVDFGDGTEELVPLGYFRVEKVEQRPSPYGRITITGLDRTAQLRQNRVLRPYQVPAGTTHAVLFARLVNGDEGLGLVGMFPDVAVPIHFDGYDPEAFLVTAGSLIEDSTYEPLAKLADSRDCTLVFDDHGELRIVAQDRDPAAVLEPDYRIRPGRGGVLVDATRSMTREGVYNVVTAYGNDPAFPTGYQTAYNNDTTSPLYWRGRFGASARYFSSPVMKSADGAASAAAGLLARQTGVPQTLSLFAVPNPAVRPLAVVEALLGVTASRHLVDSVRIPLRIRGGGPIEVVTRTLNPVGVIESEPAPIPTPDPIDTDPDPGTPDPTNPGGPPADEGTPANPGEALWIGPQKGKNHFNVGIGTDAHRDYSSTQIAGGFSSINFFLSDDKGWVVFRIRADGATTSKNTKYPRSELREFDEQDARSAWNGSSGTHRMRWEFVVDEAGNGSKPWVNTGQIHGGSDDILRVMIKGTSLSNLKLVALLRDVETVLLSSYTLGQAVKGVIEVVNGDLTITVDGVVKLDEPGSLSNSGNYFKAGCYPNFNETTGDPGSSIAQVRIRRGSLEVFHTGYAAPTLPPWKTAVVPPTSGGTSDGTEAAKALGWGAVVGGDEFTATGLPASTRWAIFEGPGEAGVGRRVRTAFSVADGVLTLTGAANGDTGGMALRRDERYGRVEARIRVFSTGSSGAEYRPVLRLWPQSGEYPRDGAIDFFDATVNAGRWHWAAQYPGHKPREQESGSRSLDIQNWHNYAVEWTPEVIRGFLDGVEVWRYEQDAIQPPGPMHLRCQLLATVAGTQKAAKLQAQWIRVYANPVTS